MCKAMPTIVLPTVWNRESVLNQGMEFLIKKRDELNVFRNLWETALEPDYYSLESKLAAEKMRCQAVKAREEVQKLNTCVTHLVNEELAHNPLSCTMKKLQNIAKASGFGLEYFSSVANDTYFPSLFNQLLRASRVTGNQLAFTATVLTVATHFSNEMLFQYELPWYVFMPMKVSLAACVAFNALNLINSRYRHHPAIEHIERMQSLFNQALIKEPEIAPAAA